MTVHVRSALNAPESYIASLNTSLLLSDMFFCNPLSLNFPETSEKSWMIVVIERSMLWRVG
ncbi:ORF1226 [White spot syndrome virus]|uniref:ORF1226 n=1 Tax=White spot syndrome virus TaxID=342409 RepID=A0A2D3I746_9VIRU|nr:ORF1226 [White spot syndrome virus]